MRGSLRDLLVLQLARLRLVCEALGIEPVDVQLDDLSTDERDRLIGLGSIDLVQAMGATGRARAAREAEPAQPPALDRGARFREIAIARRSRRLKARVRATDVSAADVPQTPANVPRGTKRDRCDQGDASDGHPPCDVNPVKHKVG